MREGSVLGMGVFIGKSTKIVNRATARSPMAKSPLFRRRRRHPAGKPFPDGQPGPGLYCAVIVKTVDEQTRSKTGINELLRD